MRAPADIRKLAGALLCLLLMLIVPALQAQTITNQAAASWTRGDRNYSITSNVVTLNVSSNPAVIETFLPSAGANETLTVSSPLCAGVPISLPGQTGPAGTAAIIPTATLRAGELLIFRVSSPGANRDPAVADHLTATITTTAGDREIIEIAETAPDSGIFAGALPTRSIGPAPLAGDCRLSISAGERVTLTIATAGTAPPFATARLPVLADPYGLVFDSEDGAPISGARVTLVDALTGAPAQVFADDGVTPWPSSMVTGSTVIDAAGNRWEMRPGEYRFPLAPLGTYRLLIEAPAPYTGPSVTTPAQLAGLVRPDGGPLQIGDASYGRSFTLRDVTPVRIDVPLDRPAAAVTMTKTTSRGVAQPGDAVFYTLTLRNPDPLRAKRGVTVSDRASAWLRLRPDSIRIDGAPAAGAIQLDADGHGFTASLGDIAGGAARTITYAMTLRADAPAGPAQNRAAAIDSRGIETRAGASVQVLRDNLAGRMTVIGRIAAGGCAAGPDHPGLAGVRVVLEDGSFALTDAEGRYHFDGLVPGTHVIQVVGATLPAGSVLQDCAASVRSAGAAGSRFVIGQGGSLAVADFFAAVPEEALAKAINSSEKSLDDRAALSDRTAAGAETDWLAVGDGPTAFLFPATDHNPRAPAVRVVIRHRAGQKVQLNANGRPVDPLSFDGTRAAPGGTYAISQWRGVALDRAATALDALVQSEDGTVTDKLSRTVYFAAAPARAEVVSQQSRLVADGSTRPVLALRILDAAGRPVHAGLSGEFTLGAPYESAEAIDALQSRALTGRGRTAPRWTVRGDDGIALVELAPTMVSGKLHLEFTFTDDQQRRRQELDAWIVPGDLPWTLVGLAEGAAGSRTIADQMERGGSFDSDLGKHGRVAFYAKGRVLGKFLLTAAYDSAKQRDDQPLHGTIDPSAYYTVFADGSDRRFDAASREKLYVRIEARSFYALYGDFETGLNQTQLARYQRAATGFKGEASVRGFHALGYAAKIAARHRRDEIQGGGISGPYRLSSRAIIAQSESVTIETRDRFRSELVVERRVLSRFIDYDIDLLAGTITFREPLLSRDAALNPQFAVIDYELDDLARGGAINAGIRADWTSTDGALRIGTTMLTDTGSAARRTDLAALDVRARIGKDTELRAETALSRTGGANASAWLVEAEHHGTRADVLAYARQAGADFGTGQLNGAERGRRKLGVDARIRITEDLSVTTSVWRDDSLTDRAGRTAASVGALYRTARSDVRLGVSAMDDTAADGAKYRSTVIEAGVTRRMLDNRLEVGASSSIALGSADAIDLPERHRLSARYALNSDIRLVGTYEIARGEALDARTARAGIELTPWTGGRLIGALGRQQIAESGKRSFAAFGLAQTFAVSQAVTIDATLDSSRTLGSTGLDRIVNAEHPLSSGGHLGESGTIAEDFIAVTLGGSYRTERWTATLRGEWRDGAYANRTGLTFGAIRQLGEGSMIGSGFTWTRAAAPGGQSSEIFDGALAAAHRPANGAIALLSKLEFRQDSVTNAVAGEAGAAGRSALTVSGDARSRRMIGSVSANWTPRSAEGENNESFVQRHELGLFMAVRHNFDRLADYDLGATTLLGGLDARIGLGKRFAIGAALTARHNLAEHTTSYSAGPQLTVSPARDVMLTIGYNFAGFHDRDFAAAGSTDKGVFAAVRMKVDAHSFDFLGLGRGK